jgi:hypothetical protein
VQDTVNGNGAAAGFGIPSRLAMDATGNIYTLDVVDSRVRKISPAGDVSTYAGIIAKGFADGQGSAAKFDQSFGIVSDADGNIYIGDSGNKRIRKINTNAQVSTIAGTGIEGIKDGNRNTAQFFFPEGVVIDKQGNLFVADVNRIRKITPAGIVSTFAGSQLSGPEDGPPGIGRFTLIEDIAIDEHNNLFASDDNLIRKISPDGVVSTIAGSTAGYKDGEGASAKFNVPEGLGIDRQGNIYVADINNHRIRKITFE